MPDEIEFYKKPSFELWVKDKGIFKKWIKEDNLWMPENCERVEAQKTDFKEEIFTTTFVDSDKTSGIVFNEAYQSAVNRMWDEYHKREYENDFAWRYGLLPLNENTKETLENELKALPELDYKDI